MRVRRKGSERRKGSRTFVNVQKVSRGKANKNMQMEGNSEGEEVWLGCTSDLKREGKVRVVAGLGWAGLGWAGLLFTCFRKGRGRRDGYAAIVCDLLPSFSNQGLESGVFDD
ncbi:hypothetical protein Lal_00042419 [Lupinus albus]|nr:hypothetical protein Lal_00042419 [Lupinus albus]